MLPALPQPRRGVLSFATALVLAVAGLAVVGPAVSPATAAEATFRCDGGSVYLVQASGEIDQVSAATGVVAGSPVAVGSTGEDAGEAGALGVSTAGTAVDVVGPDLVEHGSGAASEPVSGDVQHPVGGAVDPTSGVFYDGSYRGSTLVLHGYDLTSHTAFGPAARVKMPGAPGHDGDLAFDTAGHLYVVASSKKKATLYVASVHLPTSGSSAVKATAVKVRTSKVAGPVTGLAFASDGFLYASTAHTLQRLDPVSGVLAGARSWGADIKATDLGSCAVPSLLSVRTALPDGRVRGSDQFRGTIRSADIDRLPRALRPVGTTSGSEKGVQDQRPSELAGPAAVLPGQSYAIAAVGAGKTDDQRYVSSYRCLDPTSGADGRVLAQGVTAAGSVTVPAGTSGASVVCTVTHAAPHPGLSVTQTLSPAAFDHVGQTVTFAATVSNSGDVALGGLTVADSLPGLAARSCSPTAVGGVLAVHASTTCTTTSTVTQADLDATEPRSDRFAVSAATTPGSGSVRASASVETRLLAGAAPALSVAVSATPATTMRTGQQVTYTVVVTNSGNQTLRNVVVAAVAPGLSAPACAPVAQGGTLLVESSTTCTATRTTDQAYLASYGDRLSATARAVSPDGTTATGIGNVRTTTSSLPPTATDDTGTIVSGTSSVILPGSTNDSPGEPDGPAIDLAGGVFPRQDGVYGDHSTYAYTTAGTWHALPDGRVLFHVTNGGNVTAVSAGTSAGGRATGTPQTITYRTVDVAGHSARSTLTVYLEPGPTTVDDSATTTQGDPVSVDPLANDIPGLDADGQPAPFRVSALRFAQDQPIGDYPVGDAVVSGDGKTMTIPYHGTFSIVGSTIRFAPAPTFNGYFTIAYAAADSLLDVVRGTVGISVFPAVPKVSPDAAVTTYGRSVALPGAHNDTPGAPGHSLRFAGFVDQGFSFTGQRLSTPEGTWSYDPARDEPVFQPADGFSGVAKTLYAVDEVTAAGLVLGTPEVYQDVYEGRYTATLTVTVRTGPSARPLVLSTPHDVGGTVDPAASATPSTHLDGTPGRFLPYRTHFSIDGQPQGSALSTGGRTLVLPGRGTLSISSSTGLVSYTPAAGFVGFAGTVVVRLEDDTVADGSGETVLRRLSVLATGATPVATDDTAVTPLDVPVQLAGATNDDRGTGAAPLTVDLPPLGQPSGSVRSANGATLKVPDEGTWTVGTDGSVTFAPVPGFVDGATPVSYRIHGTGGATATAQLSVSVLPGPRAQPDVVTRPESVRAVDVLANDVPGHNADGTLGSLDRRSVRFPTAGQPAGATVVANGTALLLPAQGGLPDITVGSDDVTGVVYVTSDALFRGTTPTFRYSVVGTVTDSTGKVVRQTTSATLRVTFVGRDPVATDDTATVAHGGTATLGAATNDIPSGPGTSLTGSTTFPEDQLGDLPAGSKIGKACYDPEEGCHLYSRYVSVPGEGVWATTYLDTVEFTPEADFVGTTTPVRYRVRDDEGSAEALLTVMVLPAGTVRPDVTSTLQGVPVTVDVLANDTPARAADGTAQSYDLSGIGFAYLGQPKGSFTDTSTGDLVVPKQGRYSIEAGTARVTFKPDPTYRGNANSVYIQLSGSPFVGHSVVTRLQVHVDHVDPKARPDEATTSAGTSVRVAVLDNDDPGALVRPLVPSSVRLRSTAGLPSGSSVSGSGQLLTVTGRATFAVSSDGTITFYPLPGWLGTLPAVQYDVADVNGTRTLSTLTVRVRG